MDVTEFLKQDEIWISGDGAEVKISDMSSDHAALAARWLDMNSTGLILVVESAHNEDAINGDGHVRDVLALMAQRPREWIVKTPLHRALIKAARTR